MNASPPLATDAGPASPIPTHHGRIAITGATGYVGGRPLERLQQLGHPVRCLSRDPSASPVGSPTVRKQWVDALDTDRLAQALDGVDVAYYLVHSMGTSLAAPAAVDLCKRPNLRRRSQRATTRGAERLAELVTLGRRQCFGPIMLQMCWRLASTDRA
jgi:nucleoside-diphosphate-sugar epimerase